LCYQQTQYRHPRKDVAADLLFFLNNLPYSFVWQVFPTLSVLNDALGSGGSDGGMSLGAIWDLFEVTEDEYSELVASIESEPSVAGTERYFSGKHFQFDTEFDHYRSWEEWTEAVSRKYREGDK